MQKKYHFISGLPRSGSTLLTGILRQNPRFYSDISDNLSGLVLATVNSNIDRSAGTLMTEERIKNVIDGIFDGFYKHIDKEVIFNCNRGWTKHVEYLYQINDNFRVICCVRDYKWILNSFERIYKSRTLKQPVNTNMYGDNTLTVWHRTDHLATDSFVRFAYNALQEAYYGPFRKHLLLVEYDDLTRTPKETMKRIYDFIEEPYYEHDFNNVEYTNEEYDSILHAPTLHTVRRKVEYDLGTQILPPDLWNKYSNWEFWR